MAEDLNDKLQNPKEALTFLDDLTLRTSPISAFGFAEKLEREYQKNPDILAHLVRWYKRFEFNERAWAAHKRLREIHPEHELILYGEVVTARDGGEVLRAGNIFQRIRNPSNGKDYLRIALSLSVALRRQKLNEEARLLLEHVEKLTPAAALDSKMFKQEMRFLGRKYTTLDYIPPLLHRYVLMFLAMILVVPIVFGINLLLTQFRTLHVVNYTNQPALVKVDAGSGKEISSGSRRGLHVSEGVHTITIKLGDGSPYTRIVTVENTFLERWFSRKTQILNLEKAAAFLYEDIYYIKDGAKGKYTPEMEVISNKEILVFRDVDYVFENAPKSISTKSNDTGDLVVKTKLSILDQKQARRIQFYLDNRHKIKKAGPSTPAKPAPLVADDFIQEFCKDYLSEPDCVAGGALQ